MENVIRIDCRICLVCNKWQLTKVNNNAVTAAAAGNDGGYGDDGDDDVT